MKFNCNFVDHNGVSLYTRPKTRRKMSFSRKLSRDLIPHGMKGDNIKFNLKTKLVSGKAASFFFTRTKREDCRVTDRDVRTLKIPYSSVVKE